MTAGNRIISIDFLRGFTIVLMILVNNPGSWDHLFYPLSHSHWNGCTPTDLIFPFFIFIVGSSIAFAMSSKKEDSGIIKKIVKRGSIIFLLGILKDNFPYFILENGHVKAWLPDVWRIPGVLQRIGLVFIFTGILFIKTGWKTQIVVIIICLFSYWLLINIEIPGAFVKDLSKPGSYNFGAWLDVQILGKNHLWKHSRIEGWDPESLLGTIPALGTCLLGLLSGQLIISEKKLPEKIKLLAFTGIPLIIGGLLWNFIFPINKSLWTSSYVLFSGGIAMLCTAFCLWLIDYKSCQKFTKPFLYFGSNAIVAYVGSEIISTTLHVIPWNETKSLADAISDGILFLFTHTSFQVIDQQHPEFGIAQLASHIYAFLLLIPFYFILRYMYKRKIFVKI